MPSTAIIFGGLLVLIGIIGYIYGLINGNASITALIPAFFGVVLAGLGYAARAKEDLRKHLMHAAMIVALLGFVLPVWRLISKAGEFILSAATLSQILMAAICLIFLILGIRSFIEARQNRV